ncbi:hypothetical protein [Mucilaginibacter sp. 10B2]|uniref:hypothetical protein n=1 Tax=Mucilaginibacter sp. 10B2 TaxID=3048574 RepID=UPI002B23D839|nr:hypothetical protein [Mucilaginibacter sp. 10B2]MEB0278956.1 hypothetical protein [Mucilaginibacter sp. 10B2]
MKYLYIIFFVFLAFPCFSQSMSYYAGFGTPQWQSITLIGSPLKIENSKLYYVSSTSTFVEQISEIKEIKDADISAAYVTIGSSKQMYLLVIPKDFKYIILSDQRQITKMIFTLDSKLLNPDDKQSTPTSGLITQLLTQAVKLLKYIP